MNRQELLGLLKQVADGGLAPETAVARLHGPASQRTAATGEAHIDVDRHGRCGFPEVVYCEGKSTEAVVEIFRALSEHGQTAFGTRVSDEQARELLKHFPDGEYNVVGRTVRLPPIEAVAVEGRVAVITAGTSDRPVAEEALETLRWMQCGTELIVDVGVAGPHRLPEQREKFLDCDAVVVVAGMEGALPSVVGGFVDCPVVAVPTSVGYGASFGGVAALLGMLNSCAANVTVVNIDAGFKGGYLAGLIARRSARSR